MASSNVPSIIVLALGAGALGFPDALRLLVLIAGRRSPLTDVSICVFAMAVVTAQALGAILLARFVRKRKANARAVGDAPPPRTRTDRLAQMTLVVSLGAAFLVSACLLLVASGAGAAGLPWAAARPLLRVFREAVLLASFSFTRRARNAAGQCGYTAYSP